MTNLKRIPGIGRVSLELLEAAGVTDVEALAKADPDLLAVELERANNILKVSKRPLQRASVERWIFFARDLTGVVEEQECVAEEVPEEVPADGDLEMDDFADLPGVGEEAAAEDFTVMVNHEKSPQVLAMMAVAPFAIPLPARYLVAQKLAVGDIPSAILLNRYPGDLDVKIDGATPTPRFMRNPEPSVNVIIGDHSGTRVAFDSSRIRSTDVMLGAVKSKVGIEIKTESDRVALIRGPREATNRGLSVKSRRFVRGVLHSRPMAIWFGALLTLLVTVLLPIGIVSATLLLLSAQVAAQFGWVPQWILAFPASLLVFGVGYLIWGMSCGCDVCGQKIFAPQIRAKNSKAHHIRGLGYTIPLCLHILLFKWFRCPYCNTEVRLKK